MERQEFGKRIRELRIRAGFSQRVLSEQVGISYTYLSKIENDVLPPPGEEVILRLAEALSADKDELLTLAGKVPSDIVSRLLDNPEMLKSIRKGNIRKSGRSHTIRESNFGKRLKDLREKAGLSQGELAEKAGVNFTYLSKIENGVKPPPSQNVIIRLAEILRVDADELLASAGKVPADIVSKLKDRDTLHALRGSLFSNNNMVSSNRPGGTAMIRNLFDYRKFSRVAIPVLLVAAVASSLWFGTPAPTRALQMEFDNQETGYVDIPYMFSLTVEIEDGELLPLESVDLTISDDATGTHTLTCEGLPTEDGGTASYPAQAVEVVAYAPDLLTGSGDGAVEWNGYGYTFPSGAGVAGPSTITYYIVWTPPAGWPGGDYTIEANVIANEGTIQQTSTLTLAEATMMAETSIKEAPDANGIAVVQVNIDRIKDADNITAIIPGGVGAYEAQIMIPSSGIEILSVNGTAEFGTPTYDPNTGIFSVASVPTPDLQAGKVAELVVKLTGNNTSEFALNVAFTDIVAAGDSSHVPSEGPDMMTFRRGNTNGDGVIGIGDALFVAQCIVGQKTYEDIGYLNGACVSHDYAYGDKLGIADALYIAQYIVGQKDAYFVSK